MLLNSNLSIKLFQNCRSKPSPRNEFSRKTFLSSTVSQFSLTIYRALCTQACTFRQIGRHAFRTYNALITKSLDAQRRSFKGVLITDTLGKRTVHLIKHLSYNQCLKWFIKCLMTVCRRGKLLYRMIHIVELLIFKIVCFLVVVFLLACEFFVQIESPCRR